MSQRVLTGITTSGTPHLGNYFGAMLPAIQLQDEGDAYYFIANYHSMTSLFDAAARRQNTLEVALDFLAGRSCTPIVGVTKGTDEAQRARSGLDLPDRLPLMSDRPRAGQFEVPGMF